MKQKNGTRFIDYKEWDRNENINYNYEKYGLLNKLMSHNIIESYENNKNETLTIILNFFENSLIFLMRYIERLQHFKDIHWKNR